MLKIKVSIFLLKNHIVSVVFQGYYSISALILVVVCYTAQGLLRICQWGGGGGGERGGGGGGGGGGYIKIKGPN
jgi:uncharacterized membrane protein